MTAEFSADLTNLIQVSLPDSQSVYSRTLTAVVPWGGTATVGAVDGLDPISISSPSFVAPTRPADLPLVRLSNPFMVRGRSLVTLSIFPVRGNTIFRSVKIELIFSGATRPGTSTTASDPWFDRVLGATTVNLDQAKEWKAPQSEKLSLGIPQAVGPFSSGAQFVKMGVRQAGVYRITGAQLASSGVNLTNLVSDSIRIFNGGGLQNEFLNNRPRPGFTEIAIIVNDGGDGRFDAADEILFFGEGLNRWVYAADVQPRYATHHYASDNVYWLAIGGNFAGLPNRMATLDGTATGVYDTLLTTGRRFVHVEQDSTLAKSLDGYNYDYYEWYWTSSSAVTLFAPAPGAIGASGDSIAISALTSYDPYNGYVSGKVNNVPISWNCSPVGCRGAISSLNSGLNRFDLTLTPQNAGTAPAYFNWLELQYTSNLTPDADVLDFTLPNLPVRAQVSVTDQFSVTPIILTLDNAQQPAQLINPQRLAGRVTFETILTSSGPNRFLLVSPSQYKSPVSMNRVAPLDLRADVSQTDLLIVTSPSLVPALGEYTAYRLARGHRSRIVTVGDIMDNFSWGLYDPTAIRDFLKFSYENYTAPAPSAVLFVGDGNYDYLNHLGTGVPNYAPPYNMPYSFDPRGGDDNYVYFGNFGLLDGDTSYLLPDRGFDMMTARWPVKSGAEISAIVAKVRQYESADDLASWRKNVVIVADDEYSGAGIDREIDHVLQAKVLEYEHLPRLYHRNRIYLWDYPSVNRTKPAANEAIVEAFNSGALVVNYIGHGNPDVWAHEHVLERTADLPRMTNRDKLPLVYAASCDIGFFDDPRREAMGEDFLAMPSGGAIGVISAARLVFSSENAQLNRAVFDQLFRSESLSIAEALFAATRTRQYFGGIPIQKPNDRAYIYFGDPYLKLGVPRLSVAFDQRPDSLTPLAVAHVSGRIIDRSSATVNQSGTMYIDVYDSDRPKVHRLAADPDIRVDYLSGGPRLYHGSTSITGGQFAFDFVTPLDVNFGGRSARIEVYAALDSLDALGLVDSLGVRNSAAASTDSTGPAISYTVTGRSSFVTGDHVLQNDQLNVQISDPSGINLASGLGHGVTLEIDNQSDNVINLSGTFAFAPDSYTTGSTNYSFARLSPGEHSLKIKAWDNANNYSAVTLVVTVTTGGSLAINNLLNYPNPMAGWTQFYFELTSPADRLTLEIFTLSGRRIQSMDQIDLPADNYPNNAVSIGWDGRDAVGDRVATGVYLYKATAVPSAGGGPVEAFGKIVVIN
ncbi:MAG: type IX secretion system sortase PorU [candidate division Zixibacteria bacterium]|nr:type IX secretion system sortase PorU [candidate division Zixibacteria bacterium]